VSMLNSKRIMVVMPAFRAEKTVEDTYSGLPHEIVDKVLLVDDASNDETAEIAKKLGIDVLIHAPCVRIVVAFILLVTKVSGGGK
jgi:glycosyltransferase involved in cell wall biosynthesis